MIGLLFGVCRQAHHFAARQALAFFDHPDQASHLRCAVAAESARESLLAFGWRWPALIGEQPLARDLMIAAVQLVQVASEAQPRALHQHGRDLHIALAGQLGLRGEDVEISLQAIALGESVVSPWLSAMLVSIENTSNSALPMPPEALAADSKQLFLAQISQCFKALETVAEGDSAGTVSQSDCCGKGVVTHRGQLVHTATLSATGVIDEYRIDAPTTRRFADLSWATQGLQCLKSMGVHQAERQFGNWLAAMDPCGGASLARGLSDA